MGVAAEMVKNMKSMKVTYIPPVDPAMQAMSKENLILHGRKGENQAITAGLELLRRADNKARRAAAA